MIPFLCYTKVKQIISVRNISLKEENHMTDCNTCEFVNIRPKDLLKLGKEASVLTAIEIVPVLWHKQDYERIVMIASILPDRKEIEMIIAESLSEFFLGMEDVRKKLSDKLQKTIVAIKGSLSFCLNDHPYSLSGQSIENLHAVALKDAEGMPFWENELLNALSSEKELGEQIKSWAGHPEEIKNLIKIFNLPEDKMGELFREALEKSVESTNVEFWRNYLPEIADFAKIFNVPEEEVRKILEGIIEKDKGRYPATCIKIAQKMDILIDPQEFCRMADRLLKEANEEEYSKSTRRELVSSACNTYELLKKLYSLRNREGILKVYDSCADDYGEMTNKTIFKASKIIEGEERFPYNKQGFWDIHI